VTRDAPPTTSSLPERRTSYGGLAAGARSFVAATAGEHFTHRRTRRRRLRRRPRRDEHVGAVGRRRATERARQPVVGERLTEERRCGSARRLAARGVGRRQPHVRKGVIVRRATRVVRSGTGSNRRNARPGRCGTSSKNMSRRQTSSCVARIDPRVTTSWTAGCRGKRRPRLASAPRRPSSHRSRAGDGGVPIGGTGVSASRAARERCRASARRPRDRCSPSSPARRRSRCCRAASRGTGSRARPRGCRARARRAACPRRAP